MSETILSDESPRKIKVGQNQKTIGKKGNQLQYSDGFRGENIVVNADCLGAGSGIGDGIGAEQYDQQGGDNADEGFQRVDPAQRKVKRGEKGKQTEGALIYVIERAHRA